jgi:hypothetical protein
MTEVSVRDTREVRRIIALWRWRIVEACLYLLVAVWGTWPLGRHLFTAISQGTEGVATVPLFNLWTLWWNADRLSHGMAGYWNAPIFHPAERSFAFSEPQPPQMAVAPLVWLTGNLGFAVNVYQLASLTLNGLLGAWVCRILLASQPESTQNTPPAAVWPTLTREIAPLLCGAMLVMLPYVHWQLGVLQLGPVWGILLTIGSLLTFSRQPSWKSATGIGAGFVLTYWLCANHGLFFAIPLALATPCLLVGRRLFAWRTWAGLALAGVIAVTGIFPVVQQQRAIARTQKFDRPLPLMTSLSAHSGDYTVPPWPQWISPVECARPDRRMWWMLGVGTLKTGLALFGLLGLAFLGRGHGIRSASFLLVFATTAFFLSHGPDHQPNEPVGLSPWQQATAEWPHPGPMAYRLLVAYVPGFGQVRNVFRFCVFVQITAMLLAGCGLAVLGRTVSWMVDRLDRREVRDQRWSVASGVVVTLTLGLAAFLEFRPAPQRLYTLPDSAEQSGWVGFVRDELPDDAVLLCLPFVSGYRVEEYLNTTLWMYWQTEHHKRQINGYSGFFPEAFLQLKDDLERFPGRTVLQQAVDLGATHLVIHRSSYTAERLGLTEAGLRHLRWVHKDDRAQVDVYAILGLEPTTAAKAMFPPR